MENVDEEYVTIPSDDSLKTMPYDQNKNYKKILIELKTGAQSPSSTK